MYKGVLEITGLALFIFIIMLGVYFMTTNLVEIIKDIVVWLKKQINKYLRK